MARCAPNGSSSALCPLPAVRPSFEAGGVGLCITQDRDRLLSSSTQALKKKRYLTFHTSQRFCPIIIFLHCLYLFSSKQPRRPGVGGMLCPQPRGRTAFLVLQLHLHTGRGNCAGARGAGRDAAAGTSASPARSPSPAPACPQIAPMTPYLFLFFNILKILILFSKSAQVF